jgi:hypothetical protein
VVERHGTCRPLGRLLSGRCRDAALARTPGGDVEAGILLGPGGPKGDHCPSNLSCTAFPVARRRRLSATRPDTARVKGLWARLQRPVTASCAQPMLDITEKPCSTRGGFQYSVIFRSMLNCG